MDAERFIRHIDACTNAVLPGRRVRLRIGGSEVGWVLAADAPASPIADGAAFDAHVDALCRRGRFSPRGERFDVTDEQTGAVVATVDRGAVPVLGVRAQGVHLNGLVHRPGGLHVWVGRRAPDKKLEPDRLDHLTAGGIPAGHDAWTTLAKEAEEEASLPAALVAQAVSTGSICYAMERDDGLRRDRLFCFDLEVPDDVRPWPNDGEVVAFTLLPIAEVMRLVADTDEVKFNVNLVLIDLFLRHRAIDPDSTAGQRVARALRPLRRPAMPR